MPVDPKPDVLGITATRFDLIKDAFVQKIASKTSKPKPAWKATEEDQTAPTNDKLDDGELSWPGSNNL